MKLDDVSTLDPALDTQSHTHTGLLPQDAMPPQAAESAVSQDVFIQLGSITRLLHDTLEQLGVMPQLASAADGLPDARSRLAYVASKTADAAEKVLNSVDHAKAEHIAISDATKALVETLTKDPVRAVASGAVLNFAKDVEERTQRIDNHLTDIMLSQDFHDLTGQVVSKVVKLANNLEGSLIKLLMQVIPPDQREKIKPPELDGPAMNTTTRNDVASSQSEVDDLLASMGF